MTDHFALLGLERRPGPDEQAIRSAYLAQAARWHPDSREGDGDRFASVREAWDVLSDPARRLRHLIDLTDPGVGSSGPGQSPGDLFVRVGAAIHTAKSVCERHENATSGLIRANLIIEARNAKAGLLEVAGLINDALASWRERLSEADAQWPATPAKELANLAGEVVFLQRWKAQLDEWQFRVGAIKAGRV